MHHRIIHISYVIWAFCRKFRVHLALLQSFPNIINTGHEKINQISTEVLSFQILSLLQGTINIVCKLLHRKLYKTLKKEPFSLSPMNFAPLFYSYLLHQHIFNTIFNSQVDTWAKQMATNDSINPSRHRVLGQKRTLFSPLDRAPN